MARTITPEQHLRTLRAALHTAITKEMHAEAKQVTSMINDVRRKIEQ